VTSNWFFLSTLNYDARSTTHQIYTIIISFYIISDSLFTQRYWKRCDVQCKSSEKCSRL